MWPFKRKKIKEKIYSKLSEPVKRLFNFIESFAGFEIKIEINPHPINKSDINPYAPVAKFSSTEAIIYIRNIEHTPEQGILHMLLLLKRYWIEKIPQIVPSIDDPQKFRITSSIERAIERLVVVPLEANYGFDPYSYWDYTIGELWTKYPFEVLDNSWIRKKQFLLDWLTTSNIVKDEKVKLKVENCLKREGILPTAKLFNQEVTSLLYSKEKCLMVTAKYLNIPLDDIRLRFFDVRNKTQNDVELKVNKQKKPSGSIGWLKFDVQPEKTSVTYLKSYFPSDKESLEFLIANAFIANASKDNCLLFEIDSINQNKENHLDFELKTNKGSKFLELMEVAPLQKVHKYEKASSEYNAYDFATYILAKIMHKSDKYIGIRKTGIILLIYITDWRFYTHEDVMSLLQYWTFSQKHSFESIFFYEPLSATEGITNLIFPNSNLFWKDFKPEIFKNTIVTNLDPLKWK